MADPWALLGIGRNADIGEIRRAYARKLKVTRPDEDPAAFQALVAAREAALEHAQRRADRAAKVAAPPVEAGMPAPVRERPLPASAEAPVPIGGAAAHVELPPDEPPDREEPIHVELAPDPEPPVRPPLHVALAPDDIAPLDVELAPDAPDPGALEAWPVSDRAALAARLQQLADAPPERPDIPGWRALLSGLGYLPLAARRTLEPGLLRALGRILDTAATRTRAPRWYEPIHWLSGQAVPDPGAFPRNAALIDLVCAFDDEFGWSTSDRALYAAWSFPAAADQFKWHLSRALQARRARSAGRPSRRDGRGLPVIEPADAAVLFGGQADRLLLLLGRAHVTGHWPVSWSWPGFILAPLVALRCRYWRFVVLWLAAWVVLPAGASGLAAILPERWADMPFWLVGAAFLGLHAWFGAYGYRGPIAAGHRRLRAADRRFFSNREQRSAYLARTKPRPAPKGSDRQFSFVIMLIVIIVIGLVRLLAGQ